MWILLKSWISRYKIYVILIALLVSFLAGFKLADTLQKATALKQYQNLLQVIRKNDDTSRKQVEDYQSTIASKEEFYNQLEERNKNVTKSLTQCQLNNASLQLWNDSLKGQSATMSKNPTGIVKETSTTSSFTLEELIDNKIKNDKICNELRDQVEAIIQWDKESFK